MAARRTYHHGDLRRALLEGALAALATGGVEALTLRGLARTIGVDHTAVYRHFEDKRALLAAIAEDGFDALARALAEAAAAAPSEPIERLVAVARAYVAFALDERERFAVMFGPRLNEDHRFPSLETAIRRATAPLVDVLSAPDGDLRPIDRVMAVWSTAHGYATMVLARRIHVRSRKAALEYFERIARPQLAGLAPTKTAGG